MSVSLATSTSAASGSSSDGSSSSSGIPTFEQMMTSTSANSMWDSLKSLMTMGNANGAAEFDDLKSALESSLGSGDTSGASSDASGLDDDTMELLKKAMAGDPAALATLKSKAASDPTLASRLKGLLALVQGQTA